MGGGVKSGSIMQGATGLGVADLLCKALSCVTGFWDDPAV